MKKLSRDGQLDEQSRQENKTTYSEQGVAGEPVEHSRFGKKTMNSQNNLEGYHDAARFSEHFIARDSRHF